MFVDAGELNKRISVFRLKRETHPEGYDVWTEETLLSRWAKVTKNSGTTVMKANAEFDSETRRFLIRYSSQEITEEDFVRYQGRVYSIEYVNDFGGKEYLEIWGKRLVMDAVQTVTLYNAGKATDAPNMTYLSGVFVDQVTATGLNDQGLVNADTVKLYIPLTAAAVNALTGKAQHYLKPKLYRSKADKTPFWTLDPGAGQSSCFFALGTLTEQAKYQTINSKYDGVFRVSSVAVKRYGSTVATYLEVSGR